MNGEPIVPKNMFFGDPWSAVEGWRQVPAPTGMKCVRCEGRVAEDDQGIFEVVTEGPFVDWYPKHRTCEPCAKGSTRQRTHKQ